MQPKLVLLESEILPVALSGSLLLSNVENSQVDKWEMTPFKNV